MTGVASSPAQRAQISNDLDASRYAEQILARQSKLLATCRQRWIEGTGGTSTTLTSLLEDENLALVVELAVETLACGQVPEFEGSKLLEIVRRATAQGVSAALIISWLRTLEQSILDFALALAEHDTRAKDEIFRRISQFFNALYDYQLRQYEAIQHEMGSWHTNVSNELISYILSATVADAQVIRSQAYALGIDPNISYRAVAVRITQPLGQYERNRLKYRLDGLFKSLSTQELYLAQEKDDVIIALISPNVDNDGLLRALRAFLDDYPDQRHLVIATGEPTSSLTKAGHSCRQALSTLQVACFRSRVGKVTQCRDVILEVLLSHNTWVSDRIVDTRLEGIIDNPALVETLRAYIDSDLSLQRTAEAIYVHPNTVAYRLRQISSLTGRDMRHIHDIADLHVALTAHDVLQMNERPAHHDNDLRLVLAPDHDSPIKFVPVTESTETDPR